MTQIKKIIVTTVISVFLVSGIASFNVCAEENSMTGVEFAELLIGTLGVTVPAGSEDLPIGEYFEVLSNILASNGVTYFTNASWDSSVTWGDFVDVLYAMIGPGTDSTLEAKLAYLVDNGGMPSYDLNGMPTFMQAAEVLNNPSFSALIVEAYGPPTGDVIERYGINAPGITPESTASQT